MNILCHPATESLQYVILYATVSLEVFENPKLSNESVCFKLSRMKYRPSLGETGWFRAFKFPGNYGLQSFTLTIQRTVNNGIAMHTVIDVICPGTIEYTTFNVKNRSPFTSSAIQACKIRILSYINDPNMYIDIFLGRPDGDSQLSDDTNNINIFISNQFSSNNSKSVFSNTTTYDFEKGTTVIVPENPIGLSKRIDFDLIHSGITPNIVRINKEVIHKYNSILITSLSPGWNNFMAFIVAYGGGGVYEIATVNNNYSSGIFGHLSYSGSGYIFEDDCIWNPTGNNQYQILIKIKNINAYYNFNIISYHVLAAQLYNYTEPEQES